MGYISELRKQIGSRPIISVGATISVMNQNNEVLFQHRSDTLDWGLPGGSMELGETLEEVALRELAEETGLNANKLKLIGVFSGPRYYYQYPNGDETYNVISLFHAQHVTGRLVMNDGESLDLKFIGRDQLPNKIEKRAWELMNQMGDAFWELGGSF
ncbi:NUDIX hydrolase [Bacillus mesophilum]|uniref:NUDIX hydrolase n=1 Tax=Bacillus mesophilum TaxID=1071718 RepID=A0A7V7RKW7_9BACI|nr:NUDIX hydrolase [Bacillus mesophilum]KAB2331260.1 NUDIX hydrolase [Bacillus mesophilum]